jgi:hypothetical protein
MDHGCWSCIPSRFSWRVHRFLGGDHVSSQEASSKQRCICIGRSEIEVQAVSIWYESFLLLTKHANFMTALWIATILILIRSIYRVAELEGGFTGTIASNQVSFMILEGPMIILAVGALSVFHPGYAFDGQWKSAGWSLRKPRSDVQLDDLKG